MVDDYAYVFSADSGTGKSTHTQLWLEHFGDRAYILNDDKPAIRLIDGKVYALLNKSGTTYLYDMEKGESVFSLEGEYQLYNGKYLRKKNHKEYYDLEGNLIYKG